MSEGESFKLSNPLLIKSLARWVHKIPTPFHHTMSVPFDNLHFVRETPLNKDYAGNTGDYKREDNRVRNRHFRILSPSRRIFRENDLLLRFKID